MEVGKTAAGSHYLVKIRPMSGLKANELTSESHKKNSSVILGERERDRQSAGDMDMV